MNHSAKSWKCLSTEGKSPYHCVNGAMNRRIILNYQRVITEFAIASMAWIKTTSRTGTMKPRYLANVIASNSGEVLLRRIPSLNIHRKLRPIGIGNGVVWREV